MQQINHVFISHLHGDHYFGLAGLLSTMHLLGRKKAIYIHGPEALEEIIKLQFEKGGSYLSFEMNFFPIRESGQILHENSKVKITSLPLKHRIPCYGFLVEEKQGLRKLNPLALEKYKIPNHARKSIAEGSDFISESGKIIPNAILSESPPPVRTYAYCSDTAYSDNLIQALPEVDLLYHEATFLEKDALRAKKTFHSTAKQAAKVAALSGAKRLIMGHLSNRYKSPITFVNQARQVFKASELAVEGETYEIGP